MASQINLRDDAKAKSLTLVAVKDQVLVEVDLDFSFSSASSCVTIITGVLYSDCAFLNRDLSSAVKTDEAFVKVPVAPTI